MKHISMGGSKIYLCIAIAAAALSGCTATKALYQSNEQLIAGLGGQVGAAGGAALKQSLQPSEVTAACAGLQPFTASFCAQ